MKRDNRLLMAAHLSQLLDYVTGFGGFIVPLILWLVKKDSILGMDIHGKAIVNFQISMFIYIVLCIPLIFLFGIGILGLIIIGVIAFVFPIVNAIKASHGETPNYPLSFNIIK